MVDVSLDPYNGDPFALPGTTTAPAITPQPDEADWWARKEAAAKDTITGRIIRGLYGAAESTLNIIPDIRSGKLDLSDPSNLSDEAVRRVNEAAGFGMTGGLRVGGELAGEAGAELGAGLRGRIRRPAYTTEAPEAPPPPMGHNVPEGGAPDEPLPAPPVQARGPEAPSPQPPERPQLPAEVPAQPPPEAPRVPPEAPPETPAPPPEARPGLTIPVPSPAAIAPTEGEPPAGSPVPRVAPRGLMPPPEAQPLLNQPDWHVDNPIGTHPQENALNSNALFDEPPLDPKTQLPFAPRARTLGPIAQDLHDRGQDALKALGVPSGQILGPSPDTDMLLARQFAAEAKAALERPNATAADWYTGKVQASNRIASLLYPEIASDPDAASAWRGALAIASQGETVSSNSRLATAIYDLYRSTGRFPTDIGPSGEIDAKNAASMNANFTKYNMLLDVLGPQGATEFLNTSHTVGELRAMGLDAPGENVNSLNGGPMKVMGSAIFGPKIGGGFYQNLGGNFNPPTFDLWWMRGFGRKTGTLLGKQDTDPQWNRFMGELLEHQADNPRFKLPRTDDDTLAMADAIASKHETDFNRERNAWRIARQTDPNAPFEYVKTKLIKTAIAYRDAITGINDSPKSGAQREWMRNLTNMARELLAKEGHNVTNADLQAILWYPEKDLYELMGGQPSEMTNVDYATALAEIAAKRGVDKDAIERAKAGGAGLRAPYRGSGPAGEADVGGAEGARPPAPEGLHGGAAAPGGAGYPPAGGAGIRAPAPAAGLISRPQEAAKARLGLFPATGSPFPPDADPSLLPRTPKSPPLRAPDGHYYVFRPHAGGPYQRIGLLPGPI